MEITHLPASWVGYFNELAFFRRPSEEQQHAFEQGLADARAWLQFESAYWIHDQEKQRFDNLAFLLDELNAALEVPKLDYLVSRTFEVVELMESVQSERAKATYSKDPLINDLVLAGVCLLEGQAEERALPERFARLDEWLDTMNQHFEALMPSLPDQACVDLEVGFEQLELAIEKMEAGQCSKEVLGQFTEAAELLRVLVDWNQQARQALAKKYSDWPLPIVGPSMQRAFEQMKQLDPTGRAQLWREQIAGLWLELSFWWGQRRELLPLPASFLDSWIVQVDEDLLHLSQWEPGEEISDETYAELADWTADLSDSFGQAQSLLPYVEHLRGGSPGLYYEVIQGLLRNTLPVFSVPALFDFSDPPEAWRELVDAMLEYTKGGPRQLLYEARDLLLQLVPRPAEIQDATWKCPYCHLEVPTGRTTCNHCGAAEASVAMEVRSWDA